MDEQVKYPSPVAVMNPQYRLLYIVTIALIAGVSEADYDAGAPENIVGGIPANVGEFPYMVSLRINGQHACGGAIVDKRHVLTAAHCVETLSFPYNTAVIETGSIFNDDGEIHSIERITSHVQYNHRIVTSPYDIAIIVLKKNIIFNDNQRSVALPDGPPPSGVIASTAGWGRTDASVRFHSPYLLKINITILNYKKCSAKVGRKNKIHKRYEICGLSPVGIGPCKADSGGPLVYDGHLIGIFSTNFGCDKGYPSIYTNVFQFITWIRDNIAETWSSEANLNVPPRTWSSEEDLHVAPQIRSSDLRKADLNGAPQIVSTHFQYILTAISVLPKASSLEGLNP